MRLNSKSFMKPFSGQNELIICPIPSKGLLKCEVMHVPENIYGNGSLYANGKEINQFSVSHGPLVKAEYMRLSK